MVVTIVLISSNNRRIIGTWEAASMNIGVLESERAKVILTFKKDGTAIFKNYTVNENYVETKFEYSVSDNVITVLSVEGEALNESYTYKIKNNILKIKVNNRETEYKRVKKSD